MPSDRIFKPQFDAIKLIGLYSGSRLGGSPGNQPTFQGLAEFSFLLVTGYFLALYKRNFASLLRHHHTHGVRLFR